MFKPKKVATVIKGFQKVIDDLEYIHSAQTEISDQLADALAESDMERDQAHRLLGNFRALLEGNAA